MKKKYFCVLFVLLLALGLVLPLAVPPRRIYAEAMPVSDEHPDDADETQLAGQLLTEIMDLIMSNYVGGEVTPALLYEAALRGISDILDPYSEYLDEETLSGFTGSLSGKLVGIGVRLLINDNGQPEITKVLPDTPAKDAGMKNGDILLTVNGVSVDGLTLDDIIGLISDSSSDRAVITVRRGNRKLTFDMLKAEITTATVYMERLEDALVISRQAKMARYRYVQLAAVDGAAGDALRQVIAALKAESVTGIILDLRGNPGGYLDVAVDICRQLVPAGPILHTVNKQGRKQTMYSTLQEIPFSKMVVLVDGETASAAEVIAAALQDSGAAIIVGDTTFGKGIIQTIYNLPSGGGFKLTTETYFRRSGEAIHQIGVTPDIQLEKPESANKSADWALEQAVSILLAL